MNPVSPFELFQFCPRCGSRNGSIPELKHFVCLDCDFHFYSNAAAAVGAFMRDANGDFLFVRRAKDPSKGMLNMPGGFVDPGESVEEALAREVMEEVNIRIGNVEFLASFPNIYVYRGVTYHTTDLFFVCEAMESGVFTANTEITEIAMLPPASVDPSELAFESTRQALAFYLNRSV